MTMQPGAMAVVWFSEDNSQEIKYSGIEHRHEATEVLVSSRAGKGHIRCTLPVNLQRTDM